MMEQKKLPAAPTVILLLMLFAVTHAQGQDWKTEKRINVLFGLSQVVVAHGFNIEINYISNRMIFDYSHGVSLEFEGNTVPADLRKQGIMVKMPWTTGFGIGYRLTHWINFRLEPKFHRFEFYYAGENQSRTDQIVSYNTFSMGLGIYGDFRPFRKENNFLSGLMISPSIRYWPTLHSTLKDNQFIYFNKNNGSNQEIKTLDPGIGFTPVVFNISLGYAFGLKKRSA
jgi:hypothetical protein